MQQAEFDIGLFNRIKRDDRLALNTLFASYYQPLCAFANRYLHNKEEVEEVVSDVFYVLWQKRKQLSIKKNLKAYLYVAVKNASFAVIRNRAPLTENLENIVFDESVTESNTPENILSFKELENYFQLAVDTLPSRCKQIFLLKWKDDLSYHDIAELLGISEKTVENQLVKAMLKIKEDIRIYQNTKYKQTPA